MSTTAAAVKVLVPIADGSEEIESVTVIDTLVRAGTKIYGNRNDHTGGCN